MKICNTCKVLKSLKEFYNCSLNKDLKQGCCKVCSKINRKKQNIRNKKKTRNLTPEEKRLKKKNSDRTWRVNNPGKAKARSRRYDKRILLATPKWLSKDQQNQIDTMYSLCPKNYHVDHIVPLAGKQVSGLHVPWNLQYLDAVTNIKKSNKL